jgi:hypothetical protein
VASHLDLKEVVRCTHTSVLRLKGFGAVFLGRGFSWQDSEFSESLSNISKTDSGRDILSSVAK